MRTRTIVIGALLLGSAALAQAQDQQQQTNNTAQTPHVAQTTATPASSFVPKWGQVDFGYRGEDLSGDEARYYRFRDLRDGAYVSRFKVSKETEKTVFFAEANNVGYRDQRYFGAVESIGRLKASFEWNQVPLFLSNYGRTLYTDQGGGVLAIADSVQQTLQSAVAAGVPARDAAIANAIGGASPFDLRSRRDIAQFNMVYTITRDVDLKFDLRNTKRDGNQVFSFGFGTSPGLNPSVEMGVPVDDRTTDVKGAIEFANAKGLLSFGYDGSWFDQGNPFIRFDNPLRATDINSGPSVGQASWWPTNSAYSINVNGAYKLPNRTRATAALSFGQWEQDETLPPPTVNTALVAPPLPRSTAQTKADIMSMVFNLSSRPVSNVWLNAKYRYYDYDNKSAHFEYGSETDRILALGDWTLVNQHHETEPASFKRGTLDLDASFAALDYLNLGVGYGREDADRTFRIFEKTAEDVVRFTADSTGNDYVTVRAKYEYSRRDGSGFEEHLLDEVGEQPGMRHFDIANRKRNRFTTMLTVTPTTQFSINGAVGAGKDDYDETGFGLRDNENTNWSIGFDAVPNDIVAFSMNYGYEKMKANQYSRNVGVDPASPTGIAQFANPDRDWWIDTDDTVNTITANLDLTKVFPKTDMRFGYDLSDGEATYVYGAASPQTLFPSTPLQQLPELKNRLTIGRFDIQHFVRPNVALGLGYHYEDYEVEDFALSTNTIERPDARNQATGVFASTLYAGYLFRPYKAHTWFLRMSYLW